MLSVSVDIFGSFFFFFSVLTFGIDFGGKVYDGCSEMAGSVYI